MYSAKPKQNINLVHLSTSLCTSILNQIVDRSVIESDSANFYKMEIEKCQEYINLMQAEATHMWQPPTKPDEFENIEDVQFFHSEFCLKNKLHNLQEDRQKSAQKRSIEYISRNSSIRPSFRGTLRQRASSLSLFAWSQKRYSALKQQHQSKLKQKKLSRQLSLQKLVAPKKEVVTKSEKELREAARKLPSKDLAGKKKPYRKMVFRKKEHLPAVDDGSIPILVKIAYNISQQSKIRSLEKKEALPKFQKVQKKLERMQSTQNSQKSGKTVGRGRKLVISEYEPNCSQIKVSSWRKYNQLMEGKGAIVEENPQQFTNIHYFTEATSL